MSLEAIVWAFQQTAGSAQSKLLLIHMCDAANKEHDFECWHGIKRISERTEMSTRTVQRHLKTLCENGFISLVNQGGPPDHTSRYRVNCDREITVSGNDTVTPQTQSEVSESHHSGVRESPQSCQNDTTSGDRVTPETVKNHKGTQRETQRESRSSIFSFPKHLSGQYGYAPHLFSQRDLDTFKDWFTKDVTPDEFKEAHRIASERKESDTPSIAYINGIIKGTRADAAKKLKKKKSFKPAGQTKSTDPLGENTEAYEEKAARELAELIKKAAS